MANYNRKHDIKEIEHLYRYTSLSIREIARQQGAAEQTIRYHIRKQGWVRGIPEKIFNSVHPEPDIVLAWGSRGLEAYNIERVRGYLETHLGAKNKEVRYALNLHPRTVTKAIKKIRGE